MQVSFLSLQSLLPSSCTSLSYFLVIHSFIHCIFLKGVAANGPLDALPESEVCDFIFLHFLFDLYLSIHSCLFDVYYFLNRENIDSSYLILFYFILILF